MNFERNFRKMLFEHLKIQMIGLSFDHYGHIDFGNTLHYKSKYKSLVMGIPPIRPLLYKFNLLVDFRITEVSKWAKE